MRLPWCWRVFRALRDEWAGRFAPQAVSIFPPEAYDGDAGQALADKVADTGGALGGVTRLAGPLGAPAPDGFQARLDQLFGLAEAHGLDLDLHVDENGNAGATRCGRSRARRWSAGSRTAFNAGIAARFPCSRRRGSARSSRRWQKQASPSLLCRCATCTRKTARRTTPRVGAA